MNGASALVGMSVVKGIAADWALVIEHTMLTVYTGSCNSRVTSASDKVAVKKYRRRADFQYHKQFWLLGFVQIQSFRKIVSYSNQFESQ